MTLKEYVKRFPNNKGVSNYLDKENFRKSRGEKMCMVPTTDEWYPSYEGGFVMASLLHLSDGTWRCCVWGNDDFGLDFDTPYREKATNMYRKVSTMSNAVVAELKRLGFINARCLSRWLESLCKETEKWQI